MNIIRNKITLKPLENLSLLPYKGSTLRGGFGHALKIIICENKGDKCIKCQQKKNCIYSYIFETSISQEIEGKQKNPQLPHPFIIEPPIDKKRHYTTDDKLNLYIILIGRAVDFLPYVIRAFKKLGRIGIGKDRGKYMIVIDKMVEELYIHAN